MPTQDFYKMQKEIMDKWRFTVYSDGTTNVYNEHGMIMQYNKGGFFSPPQCRVIHLLHPCAIDDDWNDFPDESTAQAAINNYLANKKNETKPKTYTYP